VSAEIRKTQRATILALLLNAMGAWVPLTDILRLGIAQYSSRIFELRRMGFHVVNRCEARDGKRHSWFRLESSPLPSTPQVTPAKPGEAQQQALDLPVRHLDLG
jgi:hypothetical protein